MIDQRALVWWVGDVQVPRVPILDPLFDENATSKGTLGGGDGGEVPRVPTFRLATPGWGGVNGVAFS